MVTWGIVALIVVLLVAGVIVFGIGAMFSSGRGREKRPFQLGHATLNCPHCNEETRSDQPTCQHCGEEL